MNHHKKRTPPPPRGIFLVVVLVCMAVAAGFILLVVKQAVMERRLLISTEQRLQATWLAEAGVERAAVRLAADGGYTGEVWNITAADLGASHDARVTIEVKPVPDQPEQRLVRAEADYRQGAFDRNRRTKEIIVDRDVLRRGGTPQDNANPSNH